MKISMFPKMPKLILLFLFHLRFIHAQFEAKVCGHLPVGHTFGTAVYNGLDNIYFLGGDTSNATRLNTVVSYNTRTNIAEIIGEFPVRISSGASEIDETGNIFYFGGYTSTRVGDIYKLSEQSPAPVVVKNLAKVANRLSAVSIGGNFIIIIGGRLNFSKSNEIILYDTANNTLQVVEYLPIGLESASPVFDGKYVYIFGGKTSTGSTNSKIHKFNPTTTGLTTLVPTTIRREINSVKYTGGNQSIILSNDTSGSVYFTRFHHNTETLEDLNVTFNHGRLHGAVSAYVPALKTLYFHGVNPGTGDLSSEVYCVDFSEGDDYGVTCPPEGLAFLPHPTDCAKYFICNDGEIFPEECAEGLLFDTTLDKCNVAHQVYCPRPPQCPADGLVHLPYIGDCSKYYICISGEETKQECANGTKFSPDEEKCVLEAAYNCPYM